VDWGEYAIEERRQFLRAIQRKNAGHVLIRAYDHYCATPRDSTFFEYIVVLECTEHMLHIGQLETPRFRLKNLGNI